MSAVGLIEFQLYYNIIVKFLISDLNFPTYFNYVTDVITLILLIKLIGNQYWSIDDIKVVCFMLLFFVTGIIVSAINGISFVLILWGIRNHGRFFVWIIIASKFLDLKAIDKIFKNLNYFIIINLFVMLYQYIYLGIRDDYLNGFFGTYSGGNSAINTICVILTSENIAAFFSKRRGILKTGFFLSIICITCAVNEIKFYFVELIAIILILFVLVNDKKVSISIVKKCLGILLFGLTLTIIGYQILSTFYPGFRKFFQVDILLDYLTRSYNSSKVLYINGIPISNRLTAYSIVIEYFLIDLWKLLFGLGTGSFEYSVFFESALHKRYGGIAISGYLYPHVLIENGLLGVLLFLGLYLLIFIKCKKLLDRYPGKSYYLLIAGITAIVGIIINIYNSALRIESSGYLFYTVIAISLSKEVKYDQRNCKKSYL